MDMSRSVMNLRLSRARFLRLAGGAVLGASLPVRAAPPSTPSSSPTTSSPTTRPGSTMMDKRRIPSTGQLLPIIGLGTWRGFDVGKSERERAPLAEVLRVLFEAGGSVIDSSPMYGAAEGVVGDLLARAQSRERAFLATKVWTSGKQAGIRQMKRSFELLQVDQIELMQIHNLVDWREHLATLKAWKAEGRLRTIGLTHYTTSAHAALAEVMRAEPVDFVQINYALDDTAAERLILPLAADKGIAVLVNQPFGGGALLRRLLPQPLPSWAAEIGATSWAQVLLKFVLAHPAVTCAIPGTSKPRHMKDNAAAGVGPLPDEKLRQRMLSLLA